MKTNLILLLLMLLSVVKAQESQTTNYSINPKFSYYNIGCKDNDGFVGGIELNIQNPNKIIYHVDYYRFKEWSFIGDPEPEEYFNQIGLMVGKCKGDDLFVFHYQGGLSLFWGSKRTSSLLQEESFLQGDYYQKKDFITCGLITNVGFKIIPLKWFSIGIDLQANFNLENTVYMPMLSIGFGRIK